MYEIKTWIKNVLHIISSGAGVATQYGQQIRSDNLHLCFNNIKRQKLEMRRNYRREISGK